MSRTMKHKFRPVRELLEEAMKNVVEFETLQELTALVTDDSKAIVEFKHQGYDKRIGWDTYIVCVNGQAMGYTNGVVTES